VKGYVCASGPHSFSTTSNSIESISFKLEYDDKDVAVNNRAQMKKSFRKQAKLEHRALRKAKKVIPHIAKTVIDMANMIESRLKA
jgi:hypothetical protein